LKNLIIRTITGAVFVASIMACALFSPLAFAALFMLIALVALVEYVKLASPQQGLPGMMVTLGTGLAVYLLVSLYALTSLAAANLWLILPLMVAFTVFHVLSGKNAALDSLAAGISGIVLLILPLALLNFFLNPFMIPGHHTYWFVLGIFIILWTHDTFAYLSGSLFGKHPLWPSVSPKKSVEGSIGGLGFAIVAAYIISLFSPELNTLKWMAVVLIVAVFGTIGDLAESLLKRRAGMKDSGSILPGHGGMLDRIDSLLLAVPVLYVFILLTAT
jgi:phosphatidate cytidylyltransferase